MRELRTVIHIAAPIDKVWRVLADFDHWKDWNPTVKSVTGHASTGSKLAITMSGGKPGKEMTYSATIQDLNPPKAMRWRATMMASFLFTNYRAFQLTEKSGGTELVHWEEFSGLMVPLFWKKLEGFVIPTLEKMNKALKQKVETK